MKSNRGITLIVLVITIIIIIILAAVVILTFNKNNPIKNAEEAKFKNDIASIQNQLSIYASSKYTDSQGEYDIKTMNGKISEYMSEITQYDKDIKVIKGKLICETYDAEHLEWCKEIGIAAYVNDGLNLWLDGYSIPENINGEYYWVDSSKSSNNALMQNFVDVNAGAITESGYDAVTKSYNISGNNEYFKLRQPLESKGFTISLVYEPSRINTNYELIYSGTDNIDIQIFFDRANKKLTTSIENIERSVDLELNNDTINKTYKIDFTFDQNTKKRIVYVNNVELQNVTESIAYELNDTQVVLGRVLNGYYTIKGKYKNIMIYNRALNANEIESNFKADKLKYEF
ncbi:MAG: LamG-like jellyroll fold domain-containing protein [Clostridia bacterium]